MNTCSLSKAKSILGRLADQALKGSPTVIPRGGKLVILQSYDPPNPNEFEDLIQQGIDSRHFVVTDKVWEGIRRRGRQLARNLKE